MVVVAPDTRSVAVYSLVLTMGLALGVVGLPRLKVL
jgi:hypothetical protein